MGTGRRGIRASELAFVVAGVLCLLVAMGIYEAQVTIMFFDKSIDVTDFVIVTFLASLLAPIVAWLLEPRRALALASIALAIATASAVLVRREEVELVAATAGCVAGMWWIAFVASARFDESAAPPLRTAAPVALALLLVARAGARTMPLDELPLALALPIVLALAVALLWGGLVGTSRVSGWMTTTGRGAALLFALPFVFAIVADLALNGAVIAGAAGLALGPALPSSLVGLLAAGLGVAAAMVALRRMAAAWRSSAAALAVVLGGAALWTRVGPLPLAGGVLLAFGLVIAAAALADVPSRTARVALLPMLALGVGWVVSVVLTLAYYISVGSLVPLVAMIAIVTIALVLTRVTVGPARLQSEPAYVPGDKDDDWPARLAWPLAAAVTFVPLLAVVLSPAPAAAARAGSLVVMGYNIHLGYGDGDVPAIDAIADVIAAQSPDLVGLTEVTRGTVIAGGHDVLTLLAERLHMSYAFAPMLGDVEGVGVLSRVPIDEVRVVPLARSTTAKDLRRVALMVRTGDVWFVASHLGGDDIPTQTASIVAATRDLAHVVVTGDFNSVPESAQMRVLADGGFSDLGARGNALTVSPGELVSRIDYVWVRGLSGADVRTVQTAASDHLPVITTVAAP